MNKHLFKLESICIKKYHKNVKDSSPARRRKLKLFLKIKQVKEK